MQIEFTLNGNKVSAEIDEGASLLWTLRDHFKLTGAKYSCGIAQCGACTVHLDGNPVRACILPMKAVQDKHVTTIEGLDPLGKHPLQSAWIEVQVPQCGYCQTGQIMQAAALLAKDGQPDRETILRHMNGVICRCGAYPRIFKAIEKAAKTMHDERCHVCTDAGLYTGYQKYPVARSFECRAISMGTSERTRPNHIL